MKRGRRALLGITLITLLLACGGNIPAQGANGPAGFCQAQLADTGSASGKVGLRLSSNRIASGRRLWVRVQNLSTENITYGLDYRLEHLEGGTWIRLPTGPFFLPSLSLPSGAMSECQEVSIRRDAAPGHYRISKKVRPTGQPKPVIIRASFQVR
jgi:hypothetical protein